MEESIQQRIELEQQIEHQIQTKIEMEKEKEQIIEQQNEIISKHNQILAQQSELALENSRLLEEQLKSLKSNLEERNIQFQKLSSERLTLLERNEIDELDLQMVLLATEKQQLSQRIQLLEESLKSAHDSISQMRDSDQTQQAKIYAELREKFESKEKEVKQIEKLLRQREEKLLWTECELEDARDNYFDLVHSFQNREIQRSNLLEREEIDEMDSQISEQKQQISKLQQEQQDLKQQHSLTNQQLNSALSERDQLSIQFSKNMRNVSV